MSSEYTKEMEARMLEKFRHHYPEIFTPKPVDLAFGKFDGSKVFIPWYLKPFAKKIRSIACRHFVSGYFSNTTGAGDTVTFKRPKPYESRL